MAIKKIFFALIIFIGSAGNAFAQAAKHSVDIKHIALDLKFNWEKKQAYGHAAITFSLKEANDKIQLDAGMLTINSVSLQNGMKLKYNYDGGDKDSGLEILLDKTHPPATDIIIQVNYHTNYNNGTDPNNIWGSNGKGIRFFEPSSTEPKRRKQIWSMGEPYGNRYWFPCNDEPGDLRTTEFTATVDKQFTVVSNGELVKTTVNNDGTKTFRYKMDKPYPNHHTAFVVGEYIDVQQDYNGIPLHSIGYADEKEAITATVERLPDMMKFFSAFTGIAYPYKSYSQTFVQELPWGIANAGSSMQTENMVDDYRTHADFLYLWDALEAESLAGQWFANYVAIKQWKDVWLEKALARYLSWQYCEYKNGREEFLLYQFATDNFTHTGDWAAGVRQPIVTDSFERAGVLTDSKYTNSNYPYFRGSLVLHMIRKHLGDEKWKKSVQYYVQNNAGRNVTTDDFKRAIETVSGEKLDWFFDQWVYKMGHPVFNVTKKYDAAAKQLTLTVRQTQTKDTASPYPQTVFFRGKIEIEIDNKIDTVWLEPTEENIFSFSSAQDPKLVNFDYEGTWIKEITFTKTIDELLYQLENDKDILGRRSAMWQAMNIAKNEKTSTADKEKIIASVDKLLLSDVYWRLKFMAFFQLGSLFANGMDYKTKEVLVEVIKNNKAWVRSSAINLLGNTKDVKYAELYISYLNDESERVINAAAIALGKTKSPKAFDALIKLKDKPSWKNQSLISTLYGLKELGDAKAYPLAEKSLMDSKSPHWTLATPVWDHRLAAANLIVALGMEEKAFPLILQQFQKAMQENNTNDIFYNLLQTSMLAVAGGQAIFDMLKAKYNNDANAMAAVDMYFAQWDANVKGKKK